MKYLEQTYLKQWVIIILSTFILIVATGCSTEPAIIIFWEGAYEDVFAVTPNGTSVPALLMISQDFTSNEVELADQLTQAGYPDALIIYSATRRFNHHSFTWHSQDWENNNVWIKTPNDHIYWQDGSYAPVSITEDSNNNKVDYCAGDHSAILQSHFDGRFVSKWGYGPLVIHYPSETPFDSSCLNYYE